MGRAMTIVVEPTSLEVKPSIDHGPIWATLAQRLGVRRIRLDVSLFQEDGIFFWFFFTPQSMLKHLPSRSETVCYTWTWCQAFEQSRREIGRRVSWLVRRPSIGRKFDASSCKNPPLVDDLLSKHGHIRRFSGRLGHQRGTAWFSVIWEGLSQMWNPKSWELSVFSWQKHGPIGSSARPENEENVRPPQDWDVLLYQGEAQEQHCQPVWQIFFLPYQQSTNSINHKLSPFQHILLVFWA